LPNPETAQSKQTAIVLDLALDLGDSYLDAFTAFQIMSEPSDPRWDLLPHDPGGFFELSGSFDRKTLKQRYTDLIRRFKPEKHPSEFQRIRTAFEALDAELRYGQEERTGQAAFHYQWPDGEPTTKLPEIRASDADTRPSREQPVHRETNQALSLVKRLEGEEPSQLYVELERRESKSANDYYALAVLADVGEPREQLGFLQWILEGVTAFPQEPGLSALLYELLRQSDFGDENPKVLLAISRLFPSDQFYYYTESLWGRLIKRDSADRFAAALEDCEANLRDHRIGAKVTFYVRILRAALWCMNGPWIERSLAFLKENQDQISGELENEMELSLQLDRYRRSADLFIDGSPQREKIDRCIREFCTVDEQEAGERLVRTQLELAADSHALLGAVPFDEADYSAAYAALRWIAHATNVRLGIDWAPPDHATLWDATIRFMREVDSLDDPNPWQRHDSLKAVFELVAICFLATIVLIPAMLISITVAVWLQFKPGISEAIFIVMAILGVIATVILFIAVVRKRTNRWSARRRERIARRKYQRYWRYQALRFVQKTQYPLEDVRNTITTVVQQDPGVFRASSWLPGFMARDFGLTFYALAHLYER
jgi:hypothetical protein